MNTPLYLRSHATFAPDDEALALAELEAYRDTLPRAVGRRMGTTGLIFDRLMEGESPAPEDAMILASEYGVTRTLEEYLAGFPAPSPLAFQNSIHPAGAEQYLVPRKLVTGEFFPLAGEGVPLLATALSTIFLARGSVRRLLIGEERGVWMSALACGSPRTFGARMTFTTEAEGATHRLEFIPEITGVAPRTTPLDWVLALIQEEDLLAGSPDTGYFALTRR